MSSTTLMTIGTALGRAKNSGAEVMVYMGAHTLTGRVSDVDGYGVMLQNSDDQFQVIKLDSIDAVQFSRAVPL
jgi:sRNA-binding regulator protein Hfq